MANTILITANWHTGALSQQTISRQYDNNRYVVQFVGYPEASEGNELDYYLLVWMSSAPGENPDEIAPIQLASDQWYISNVFTQQTQQIKFQMCALNTAGTFEAHSPIFTGFVRNSLEHDGTTQDIDVSTLFDAYREYLNELIIQAGAVVIDPTPTQGSSNAVSSGGVYESLASKIAKPLTSPNGTNGQILRTLGNGQTEWTDFATPTSEQVGEAVDEWLDEHPEATTTVQDGSLTEAKFSPALKLATVKDYVTPEMFGAVGDGVTDDTQAIQDALDASACVRFGNKVYLTTGVEASTEKELFFNNTEIQAISDGQPHIFKFTGRIVTHGRAHLRGLNKALIGLDLGATNMSGRSIIECFHVTNCKIWGVYLNAETLLLEVGYLSVSGCGVKDTFAITRTGDSTFSVDAGNRVFQFDNYIENAIVVATDFKLRSDGTKTPFYSTWKCLSFTKDTENGTTGTITLRTGANNKISTEYTGERTAYVLIGGGVGWEVNQGGASHFRFLNLLNNAIGFSPDGTNRNVIDFLYSQEDGIPIGCRNYNIGMFLGTFGVESPKTGINVYSYAYLNLTIGSECPLDASKVATNATFDEYPLIVSLPTVYARKARCTVYSGTMSATTLYEDTADTYSVYGIKKITIRLRTIETEASSRLELIPFGVKTFYVSTKNNNAHGYDVQILLHQTLIDAGYTLRGATDNALTVACSTDTAFILRITKIGTEFVVSKESYNVIT